MVVINEAEPDTVEIREIGGNHQIGIEPRRLEADGNLARLEHQPQPAPALAAKIEFDDDPLSGKAVAANALVDLPEEQDRIHFLGTWLAKRPAHAPRAKPIDHVLKIAAGLGQFVLAHVSLRSGTALEHAGIFQLPKACGEKRAGDSGQPALDVVEVTAAGQQLAKDERGPPVRDDLRRAGNRTILSIIRHGVSSFHSIIAASTDFELRIVRFSHFPPGEPGRMFGAEVTPRMARKLFLVVCVAMVCLSGRASSQPAMAAPDPIAEWSLAATTAAAAVGMPPLRTPISLAILHVAMFEAVGAVAHGASAYAAAVEAGYRVLLVEFPSRGSDLERTYRNLLAAEPDSPSKSRGLAAGGDVAQRVLSSRANDGRNATMSYVPGSGPGAWIPTPPDFLPVTTAFLAKVAPFTMNSPSQFRPAGPPSLGSKKWASDYNEVKTLGAKDGSTRTPEQTATALFWEPLAGTVWIPTIRRIARERELDLESSARFQAAGFAAFADSLIACWDAKIHFNTWRPITAIQNGDPDGNPGPEADPQWQPFAVTPNFPEYPSGHTCVSAAVAHTIENFFHNDVLIPARNVVSGEERVYRRASHLVDEVVEARMLLGLHFRAGDEDGAEIGRRIARQIRGEWLKSKP